MKKKTIEFVNRIDFEERLLAYKQELLTNCAYEDLSMYFHIFSTELQEEAVRPIWESIEKVFPGKPWFGHSTAGNADGSLVMSADVEAGSIVRLSYGEPNTIMKAVQGFSHMVSSCAKREI